MSEIQSLFSVPKNRWAEKSNQRNPAGSQHQLGHLQLHPCSSLQDQHISACRDFGGHARSPGGLQSPARQHTLPLSLQTTMLGAERVGESPHLSGTEVETSTSRIQEGTGWRAATSPVMDQLWEINGKGWKGEAGAGISTLWERATPESSPRDNVQHPGHTDAP